VKDLLPKLLQNLPQILSILPQVGKFLPWLIFLVILAGLGYIVIEKVPALYVCAGNQLWEWKIFSNAYTFVGDTCIDGTQLDKYK
jgi:hypothetical protein